jgi:hypothetical protein
MDRPPQLGLDRRQVDERMQWFRSSSLTRCTDVEGVPLEIAMFSSPSGIMVDPAKAERQIGPSLPISIDHPQSNAIGGESYYAGYILHSMHCAINVLDKSCLCATSV